MISMKKWNSTLKGKKINLEVKDSLPYLCSRQFSQTLNLSQMLHSTNTERKKAQMASALFNDVQLLGSHVTATAEWDDLRCDEQMRLEDLIGSAQ